MSKIGIIPGKMNTTKGLTVALPISKRLPSKERMVSKKDIDKLDKESNMKYLNNLLGLKKIN